MKWKSKLLPFRDKHKSEHGPSSSAAPVPSEKSSIVLEPFDERRGGFLTENWTAGASVGNDLKRSTSHRSEISKFGYPPDSNPTSKHARQRSADRRSDPLGLTVLYTPERAPATDIIFVHGLGGSSRQTWSYNRDSELFWPKLWLPKGRDLSAARILTFGYDAHFLSAGPNCVSGIPDFAKSLLFEMKYAKDDVDEDLGIGKRPIIFVVHSMGGLVFKKAYMQGVKNDDYKDIVSQVRAVLFLSTPHRGTGLAELLNRILSVSIFNHSPKRYINELKRESHFIEDINENFRDYASKLRIFSFYETLETPVGLKNVMVLPPSSAILGYPGEISQPLNVDHHHVCKFRDENDTSYKCLRSVLKTLVSECHEAETKAQSLLLAADMQQICMFLGSISTTEAEYTSFLDRWRPGTCESMDSDIKTREWKCSPIGSKILWVHAQPGSGKSVKAAVQIRNMRESGMTCSYYFFTYSNPTERSPGSLLRSLIFQVAQDIPAFRRALLFAKENGVKAEKMEARLLWEKIFVGTMFKLKLKEPLYFVIDALDESDSVNTIMGFFSTISTSKTPIRILVTSRKTPDITTAFERISTTTPVESVSVADNSIDIRRYATTEMKYMHGSAELRNEIVDEIVGRSQGNFLWVRLALNEIMKCSTPDDIRRGLSEIPPDMETTYKRMEISISSLSRDSDISLARLILSWVTYARRPLDTEELMLALQPEMPSIIDLQFTISQVCGQFVTVGHNNRVTLIHQTAREYLTKSARLPFPLTPQEVHEELFHRTLGVLLKQQIPSKMNQISLPPFYDYAATSWAYHLDRSSAGSDASLTLLVKFLGDVPVIYWIRILAVLGQLKILVLTSSTLQSFAQRRRKLDSKTEPTQHRLTDLELLETWANDLLKLVGKFGSHLLQDPAAIQESIPQFSPRNSALFRQFGKQAQLSVKGVINDDWDDCLARVSIASGHQAMSIICSARHIAALTSGGTIVLWDSVTFEEMRSICHQEHIFAMCFSSDGQVLASYGFHSTRIWNASTGCQLHKFTNPPETRALCINFVKDNTKLIVGLSARKVAEISLNGEANDWLISNSSFLQEDGQIEGAYLNAPTSMAFSVDGKYVAVAYRGFPLAIWDMTDKKRVKRCRRESKNDHGPDYSWSGVNRVIWHPNNKEILGLYTDGIVFKWNPFQERHEELQSDLYGTPSEIQCSPNGIVFATSDVNGVVKLYNYEHFSLIYRLSSEDIITSLCFSPDSRRFYDIRGSYCNAWEPNALVRLPDIDEQGSEIDVEVGSVIISHHASESWAEIPTPITALSPTPRGGHICTGNEDGSVELYHLSTLESTQVGKCRGEMNVEFIEWADDGMHFAYYNGDLITVKKIEQSAKGFKKSTWTFQSVMDISADLEGGKISQILLSPNANLVMVVDSDVSQVWSTQSKGDCKTLQAQGIQKWANHPLEPKQVLAFTLDGIASYTWETLEFISQWQLNTFLSPLLPTSNTVPGNGGQSPRRHPPSEPNTGAHEYVDEVIISHSRVYALVLVSQQVGSYHRRWSRLQIVEISSLKDTNAPNVDPVPIPEDIMTAILRPLGVLGKDQLVFLDKSFWVCSWRMRSTGGLANVVRHFFLPRDWVSVEVLGLCRILGDGTFLCPRKGQVAVIRSSLGRDW